ncbi:Jerky -like [Araneus ventricosus]|uniref:Jerky-like n=1 Tax=Araneus ventricosus TaxID=182803 RepID=A0A4Y2UXU8_ARAVE|nr:Jerky -like [Araneus ventricosus]
MGKKAWNPRDQYLWGTVVFGPCGSNQVFKKFEDLVKEKSLFKEQICKVDETGLYYRMLPTKTLASRKEAAAPGYKRSKDRVTVSLCGNAAGMHKLPVMLIGKSVKPTAFKNVNVESLPAHYRALKTAWMNQ